MIHQYRKLPETVRASEPVTHENASALAAWCGGRLVRTEEPIRGLPTTAIVDRSTGLRLDLFIEVPTLQGPGRATLGDRIVQQDDGQFFVLDAETFARHFELIGESL